MVWTKLISNSTKASVISEDRIQHSATNNVNRTDSGASRRSEGYIRAARARHASTSFSLASANSSGGSFNDRTAGGICC
jgi:hypothetical protein